MTAIGCEYIELLPKTTVVSLHNYFLHFKYANFWPPPISFIIIQLNYVSATEYSLI